MSPHPDVPALLAEAEMRATSLSRDKFYQHEADCFRRLAKVLRETHEARVRAEEAIRWALGEGDSDFGDHVPKLSPMPNHPSILHVPAYWWRDELRRRAALSLPQGET